MAEINYYIPDNKRLNLLKTSGGGSVTKSVTNHRGGSMGLEGSTSCECAFWGGTAEGNSPFLQDIK